jgi:hypothetical protein
MEKKEGSSPIEPLRYMSLIMTLMYIARLTRADLLFPVTVLSSYCKTPSEHHMGLACRVLIYLEAEGNWGILFKPVELKLGIYVDAGHMTHHDSRGHIGIIMTMGSGYVFAKSTKMRLVTLSSKD